MCVCVCVCVRERGINVFKKCEFKLGQGLSGLITSCTMTCPIGAETVCVES